MLQLAKSFPSQFIAIFFFQCKILCTSNLEGLTSITLPHKVDQKNPKSFSVQVDVTIIYKFIKVIWIFIMYNLENTVNNRIPLFFPKVSFSLRHQQFSNCGYLTLFFVYVTFRFLPNQDNTFIDSQSLMMFSLKYNVILELFLNIFYYGILQSAF